jgi:hypothetical protein
MSNETEKFNPSSIGYTTRGWLIMLISDTHKDLHGVRARGFDHDLVYLKRWLDRLQSQVAAEIAADRAEAEGTVLDTEERASFDEDFGALAQAFTTGG